MTRQFNRRVTVSIGPQTGGSSRQWTEELQIQFNVTRTAKGRPDKASVTLHNLSPESRSFIIENDSQILLHAGYRENGSPPLLLRGDVDEVEVKRGQTGTSTIIKARDSGASLSNRSLERVWTTPTTVHRALQDVAQDLGLRYASVNGVEDSALPQGFGLNGRIRDALGDFLTSMGAEYAVRSGELIITPFGQALPSLGYLISAETGMVGSPTAIKKKGRHVGVNVKMLLNGRIKPKDRVRLDSLDYQGVFEVRKVIHAGSSRGTDYYTTVECRRERS